MVLAEDDDTYSPTMFPYVSVDDLRPFQSGLTRALSHSRFSAGVRHPSL